MMCMDHSIGVRNCTLHFDFLNEFLKIVKGQTFFDFKFRVSQKELTHQYSTRSGSLYFKKCEIFSMKINKCLYLLAHTIRSIYVSIFRWKNLLKSLRETIKTKRTRLKKETTTNLLTDMRGWCRSRCP